MKFDPVFLASSRSDAELMERIDNREKYMPETTEASLGELQRRGKYFSEEELNVIREDIKAQQANAESAQGNPSIFRSDADSTVVQDPDAPALYSRRVLYVFAVLTSTLVASILMAINISRTKNREGIVPVILFGFAFTFLGIYLMVFYKLPAYTGIIIGIIAGNILNYYFWNRYIGRATFYRVKMAWVPLAVIVVLLVFLVALSALTKSLTGIK